jgi:UDP-glucuronate 4-epimerase
VFGDGSTGRDYTYVDDIVSGVLSALEYDPSVHNGVPFDVFNLGNSSPVKLNDLISTLERVTGRKCVRQVLPVQSGDVSLTWANISKAEKLLGYHPAVKLEEGLRRFVEWYRRQVKPI